MAIVNLVSSIFVISQLPGDAKIYAKTTAELQDLGVSNYKAFYYYEGLIVYCLQANKKYIWREEVSVDEADGLLVSQYTYPAGAISNGIDYSGRKFNFFIHQISSEEISDIQETINNNENVYNNTVFVNSFKKEDKIIAGELFWLEDLTFLARNFVFIINGIVYEPGPQTIVLNESDPVYTRKDVFVVDSETENVVVLEGDPSANPIEKIPEYGKQLRITSIDLLPGDTKPNNVSNEIIYNENEEWVASVSPAGSDLENVDEFFRGAKSILLPALAAADNILTFTNIFRLVYNKENVFFFAIKLTEPLTVNSSIVFSLEDTLIPTGFMHAVDVNWLTDNAGLDNSITTWQLLRIDLGLFNFNRTEYDIVSFKFINTPILRLDFIGVQSGIIIPTEAVYVPTKLSEFENDVPYVTFQDLTPIEQGNSFINAGVQWLGTGLNYRIWGSKYITNNVVRTQFVQGNVTLDDGGALPRIDVFYIQNDGINPATVGVKKGTEDVSPQKPDLDDPINQVEISFKIVNSGETVPPDTVNIIIYDETGGGEWANISVPTNFSSLLVTDNPYRGLYNFRNVGGNGVNTLSFNAGTPIPNNSNNKISFALLTELAPWGQSNNPNFSARFIITLRTATSSATLTLRASQLVNYGLDSTLVNQWQLISIPISLWNVVGNIIGIDIGWANAPYFRMDYIHGQIEGQVTNPVVVGNQDNGLYFINGYMVDRRGDRTNKTRWLAGNILYGIGSLLPTEYIIALAKIDDPTDINNPAHFTILHQSILPV